MLARIGVLVEGAIDRAETGCVAPEVRTSVASSRLMRISAVYSGTRSSKNAFCQKMTSHWLILEITGGAILALPYLAFARRSRRPPFVLGAGLVATALVYVTFAFAAGDVHALMIEIGGLIAFGALVMCSLRWSPFLLAFGWIAHIVWDLFFHPIQFSSYAPQWYPAACVGFDLLVAGFAFATLPLKAAPAGGR